MVAEAFIELKPRRVKRGADCLLIVPPLVKYNAGPLLGPAMLKGACASAGFRVDVLDLNILFLNDHGGSSGSERLVGDHDRDAGHLGNVESAWLEEASQWLPSPPETSRICVSAASAMLYEFEAIEQAAERMVNSDWGNWIHRVLSRYARPSCVGLSIMFSGQVLWAMTVAIIARRIWPGVGVLAGGAHVTALKDEIVNDPRYGRVFDRFVFGYAERTFVAVVRAFAMKGAIPSECVRAGDGRLLLAGGDGSVTPEFGDLSLYRRTRTTLPAQYSRGCAYGRCRFCTYPAVEGVYHTLPDAPVVSVIERAAAIGGAVSFKDSLIVGKRLEAISHLVGGRVEWSACTKMHPWLNAENLAMLRESGCRTLELGVETLVGSSQRLIGKVQTRDLFESVLMAASNAEVGLVVNTITGFPFEDAAEAHREWKEIRSMVDRVGGERCKVEHNRFELERRAPLATDRAIRVTRSWPWSSLLDWEEVERPIERGVSLPVIG
ncbi:MAG: hypothetical protein KF912_04775 [Phycisphaeraceae bacterium]|nr:hypothetical protein [Phycisphaeraceae bacterium]